MRIRRCTMFLLLAGLVAACGETDEPSTDDESENARAGDDDDDDSADEDDDERDSGRSGRDAGSMRDSGGRTEAGSSMGGRMADSGRSMGSPGDAGAGRSDSSTSGAREGGALDGAAGTDGDGPCPSAGEPCKILPLGDSITYGLGYSGGYRVELFNKAQMAGQQITFLGSVQNGPNMVAGASFPKNNEGHSGWTIDQIAGLVPNPALEDKPNIVLLMAGTNDMYGLQGPEEAPERLGTLLDKLTDADPDMYIVVAQLTPLGFSDATVQTFNAALPAIVDERVEQGKHIVLVDMHTGFPDDGLGDMVHPNRPGYEFMAGVWYAAIEQWLR